METLCRMIVSIRFAILHLFLYASLYPPASVPSPRGRSCVSGLCPSRPCIALGTGARAAGRGGIQRATIWFLDSFGHTYLFFH